MLLRKLQVLCLAIAVWGTSGSISALYSQERVQGNWSLNQPAVVPSGNPISPQLEAAPDNRPVNNFSAAPTTAAPAVAAPRATVQVSLPLLGPENSLITEAAAAPGPKDQQAESISETTSSSAPNDPFISGLAQGAEALGATRLSGSFVQTALLLGALGLAPAILLMTTCYIRIMVVLGLLRQALGATQLPPTQILMSLSMFLTILVMTPVWMEIKTKAFDPWSREEKPISWEEAWNAGTLPLKQFMAKQIEICGNRSAVDVLYRHGKTGSAAIPPKNLADAPLNIVLPAFILSELKVAFLLGFQIFLPFLILDLVVSTVTVSMGLAMLPPTMVSLPLKLILFVLVDGWNLVVGMLLQSFGSV